MVTDVKDSGTVLPTVSKTTKQLRIGLSVLTAAGLLACGGRVIPDEGQAPASGGSAPSKPAPTTTAKVSTGKPGSSDPPLPSKELGECVPGFDRAQNPELPCRWLTESGMCFDDSDAACACICPTDRDSICSHGFDDGPNSARLIRCF